MTTFLLALIGGAVGSALFGFASGGLGASMGWWTGTALGALAGVVLQLRRRIAVLEELAGLHAHRPAAGAAHGPWTASASPIAAPPPVGDRPTAAEPVVVEPVVAEPPARGHGPAPPRTSAGRDDQRSSRSAAASAVRRVRRSPPHALTPIDTAFEALKRWFTTGNVPVKAGVVLSLFGVGFLVKEGIAREWLVLSIEARLAAVAFFGIALLALGWRLRESRRSYALPVQGGGVAVLYLTTYAAFAVYSLLPATAAFALLTAITVGAGSLAVLQDSRALAVLGIVGGFMAPLLAANPGGNHVALFSYYTILNLAILGIAWFKAWRELNVLGFAFTFAIGSVWGYVGYRPEQFATTEPFLVLSVVLYTLIPVLFALRQTPTLRGFVDGTLVFGTPIAGFALQTRLLEGDEMSLALSSVVLAAWYVGLAAFVHRRGKPELDVLVQSLAALGIAFATIAVPLALDARWTSVTWALQGAAMVWLGLRQHRPLALAAGAGLQVLAGYVHLAQVDMPPPGPFANGHLVGGVLLALAGGFTSLLLDRATRLVLPAGAAAIALVWAAGWWFWTGFVEIDRHFVADPLAAGLVFVAATALAAMIASDPLAWPRLNALGLVLFGYAAAAAVGTLLANPHPFARFGWLAWPFALAAMLVFLRVRETLYPKLAAAGHAICYWSVALIAARESAWLVEHVAGGVWPLATGLSAAAALTLATLAARTRIRWPLMAHARLYTVTLCGGVVAILIVVGLGANLLSPGDPAPLPYVPILNPLELASALVLATLVSWWRSRGEHSPRGLRAQTVAAGGALLGLSFLTMAVARAAHHYAGVPFDLGRMAESGVVQAALSIVWGLAGLTAMAAGARGKHRAVWIGGALLMAVVVVKLFLVELGDAGTLSRVVSFLGVGLLLLVVGYFAPAPPRADADETTA